MEGHVQLAKKDDLSQSWLIQLLWYDRWGTWRQPQPEWPDRTSSRDALRAHTCTLHPDKQRHCTDGNATFVLSNIYRILLQKQAFLNLLPVAGKVSARGFWVLSQGLLWESVHASDRQVGNFEFPSPFLHYSTLLLRCSRRHAKPQRGLFLCRLIRHPRRSYGEALLSKMHGRLHPKVIQTPPHGWSVFWDRFPPHAVHGAPRVSLQASCQPVCAQVC